MIDVPLEKSDVFCLFWAAKHTKKEWTNVSGVQTLTDELRLHNCAVVCLRV